MKTLRAFGAEVRRLDAAFDDAARRISSKPNRPQAIFQPRSTERHDTSHFRPISPPTNADSWLAPELEARTAPSVHTGALSNAALIARMLGWSLKLFRVRGIQLSVHASFFLLLAWVGYEGWKMGELPGLLWSVATLLAFFVCVVLHEFGHSFTAMHYGIGVRRILLMPIGGMAEFESIPREPSRELLITLAGPAVNFAIAGLLWMFVDLAVGPEYPATILGVSQLLLYANLVMGCFNLLPVFPMDGGRIFRALLAWRMPYLRATFWAATVGKVLAVAAAIIAVVIWNNYLTAVLFGFIYFAGEAEYRAVRRREIDDARWREMLARFYAPRPPEEPPILTR